MKPRSPFAARALAIQRVETELRVRSFPRLQMSFLVALTGAFGLLASFVMLQLGLDSMAMRYPLALAAAYAFFLVLLWLWLRTSAQDYLDIPDPSGIAPSGRASGDAGDLSGGGNFGAGGTSGSFEGGIADLGAAGQSAAEVTDGAFGVVGDADEMAVPIVVIALAVGLAVASLYVVYMAPALFAEVLVDGTLSYVLFRRLRSEDRPFWLASAVRSTILPFAATGVFLAGVGAAMALYAPGASSVGEVVQHATTKAPAR